MTKAQHLEASAKVMTIANNLHAGGMSRSAAMRRAWAVVKAAAVETKVAGVTFGRRQIALARLTQYPAELVSVRIERDYENPADASAVAVHVAVAGRGSYQVGYLPRQLAAVIAPLMDAGKAVKVSFQGVTGGRTVYENRGMRLTLAA
jgi:hypothetical protein